MTNSPSDVIIRHNQKGKEIKTMYEITIKLYNGKEKTYRVCDEELAWYYLSRFILACDVDSIVMTDGLTGEVIKDYR